MVYASCPNCESDVPLRDPKIGKNVLCTGCGAGLKIVWLLPVELDILNDTENFYDQNDSDFFEENKSINI